MLERLVRRFGPTGRERNELWKFYFGTIGRSATARRTKIEDLILAPVPVFYKSRINPWRRYGFTFRNDTIILTKSNAL